jgi:hypothetical protein
VRKLLKSKDGLIDFSTHNPKVVSSNLTPAIKIPFVSPTSANRATIRICCCFCGGTRGQRLPHGWHESYDRIWTNRRFVRSPHRQRVRCSRSRGSEMDSQFDASIVDGDFHVRIAPVLDCSIHRCSLTPFAISQRVSDSSPMTPGNTL